MNTSDVQVYSYVTDHGRRISVTLATFGEIEEDRKVDVSIMVDDVEQLHSSTHWHVPPGVPLGEWLIYAIMQCLCDHMAAHCMFQLLQNLLAKANADEVQMVPIDDRHIAELTDTQAEWWNGDENHILVDYLIEKSSPLAEKAIEEYPQLRVNKENH